MALFAVNRKHKYYFTLLSNLMVPLAGMSTDIYLPSMPAMSEFFDVSRATIQLTITCYVLAMGIGQLIVGPISDALGRRRIIISALILQLVSVIGILYARNIELVLLLRFIQGLAMAFMIVPARAIINDVFEGAALKKQFSYITISFAMGPIVAPYIGGYLQYYFGWQANFHCILIYSIFVLALVFLTFPETIAETKTFHPKKIFTTYLHLFENRLFFVTSIFAGMMMAYSTLFSMLGPFVIQSVLGYSSIVYGYMALIIGLAWLCGNLLNRILFDVGHAKKMQLALWGTLAAIVTLLIISLYDHLSLVAFIAPVFVMVMLGGLTFGIAVAEGLSMFPKLAASANACLFSIVWFMYFTMTILATLLHVHTLTPLALTYLAINLAAMGLYYRGGLRH